MKTGIYPGSFDPVTIGHLDVIKRSAKIVDRLIIGVLKNHSKNSLFTTEERAAMLEMAVQGMKNVTIEAFDGLTVAFAKERGASVLVRGLRAVSDFEYELQLAQTNHKLDKEIDTIFFTTSVEYSFLSSSVVKEVARYGGDIRGLVPECIIEQVYKKCSKGA